MNLNWQRSVFVSGLLLTALTGCSSKPEPVQTVYNYEVQRESADSVIGKYFDDQYVIFSEIFKDYQVQQTGANEIKITIPASVGFVTGSSELNRQVRDAIQDMGDVLNDYKESSIWVYGHTDNVGNYKYNLKLSQKRATSVSNELVASGVNIHRINKIAESFEVPKCSNATTKGKECNRRVELVIRATPSEMTL